MVDNTLLIVGNGFDRQCDLNSDYESFFNWLQEDKERANDNFWSVHFLNNPPKGKRWVDVESRLLWTLTKTTLYPAPLVTWVESAVGYYRSLSSGYPRPAEGKEIEYIVEFIRDKGQERYRLNYYHFLDELRKFEKQFSEYLRLEVSNNTEYLGKVASLLERLTEGDNTRIITFNYTDPFSSNVASPSGNKINRMVSYYTHVHGTYSNSDVIFGVDTTSNLKGDACIFSKTYRKMLQPKHSRALFSGINKIKFYGHSLGEADYSYFQSIFDSYNLYGDTLTTGRKSGNSITLHFYFAIYDENKETQIRRNATKSVYDLIKMYGETFDNKAKGKNLLHKLLLEERIQLEFLRNLC